MSVTTIYPFTDLSELWSSSQAGTPLLNKCLHSDQWPVTSISQWCLWWLQATGTQVEDLLDNMDTNPTPSPSPQQALASLELTI